MLWLDYPKETETFAIEDEFLIGELLSFLLFIIINCRRWFFFFTASGQDLKKKKKSLNSYYSKADYWTR